MVDQREERPNSSLKVLITSSSYPLHDKDWKSVFIKELIHSISEIPDIDLSYWGPPGDLPGKVTYTCQASESLWLDSLMKKGGVIHLVRQGGLGYFTPFKLLYLLKKSYIRNDSADLFHINWLQNAIPLIGTKQPAVISVLGSDLGLLKLPGMTQLLRQVFKTRKSIIAPNAEWMVESLVKKFGDIAEVKYIPLGIDEAWYGIKREICQDRPFKWLAISRLTKKKLGKLFEWGELVFSQQEAHELHLFGPMQEEINLPEWVHYHGPTYPDELREKWIPGATGFVTLSEHDEGRPQIMLESMAAGLPIIASLLPAHENIINHKITGWLTNSVEDFGNGITWLSKSENNENIAKNARKEVAEHIGTWRDCAKRYNLIYKQLLKS